MTTPKTALLLELVAPQVRRELVRQRVVAMRGELEQANTTLRMLARDSESDIDAVALTMARAELLYLDDQIERAQEPFESVIRPRLNQLDLPVRLVVEQNHLNIRFDRFGPDTANAASDFYHLYDRSRAADIEWSDPQNLAMAQEAIEGDKHRQALAALWSEAIRTYRQACWEPHRRAMRGLGQLWLRIGQPADAAYCAILARNDKLAQAVADDLLERMDGELIRRVVAKIVGISNMRKHFCVACELLTRIGDAIPDDQLGLVANWILLKGSIPQDPKGTAGPLYRAWKTLLPIAQRLPSELARRAVGVAVAHPAWTGVQGAADWIAREQQVKTVNHLVEAVPHTDLMSLAHQALPLALDRMMSTDYTEVIDLLCHIAKRGGEGVRDFIGKKLYAADQPKYNILGRVAQVFRKELSPELLALIPSQVVKNVRLQVQRKSFDQPFEVVPGTIMTITKGGKTVQTCVVNMTDWHAAAKHRKQLPSDDVQQMALAAIDMLIDPDNDMANRSQLIEGLMSIADTLDESTIVKVFDVLEGFAKDQIQVAAEEKSGPLDSFKFNFVSKHSVRRIALIGAARVGSYQPDTYRHRVEDLVGDAFSAPEFELRQGAFAAFETFPGRLKGSRLAVLLGTRDHDPNAAISAFAALAWKHDLTLDANHWRLLLYSARLASQSTNSGLRRHAATALSRLFVNAPNGTVRQQAKDVLTAFGSDICASVRRAARLDERVVVDIEA